MSQQINLILPALRPKFDWLGLPVVAVAALFGLVLMVAWSVIGLLQVNSLKEREAATRSQLANLQQQIQSLGQSLGARRGDATLQHQIDATRLAVLQRQEVLTTVAQGDLAGGNSYSGLLQGFSRQGMEGVWLVGFGFAGKDIEIRGRLVDPSLLPRYINRLNDEAAFAGRQFAALDMTGVEPRESRAGTDTPTPATAQHRARYTEFVLRTVAQEKTP